MPINQKLIAQLDKIELQQKRLEEKRLALLEKLHDTDVLGFKLSLVRDRGKRYFKAHKYENGKTLVVHVDDPRHAEEKIVKWVRDKEASQK